MTPRDGRPDPGGRGRAIRNAVLLALAALAVYVAFILMMAGRSSQGLT